MSAFNLQLKPSRAPCWALLALSLLPAVQLGLMPVQSNGWWLLLVVLPLYFWQCHRWFGQPGSTKHLVIAADNQLHWFAPEQGMSGKPALAQHGLLQPGGRVSEWFIQLCWQQQTAAKPQRRYCWILADQCSEAEYRALARIVTQLNWQHCRHRR